MSLRHSNFPARAGLAVTIMPRLNRWECSKRYIERRVDYFFEDDVWGKDGAVEMFEGSEAKL